MLLIYIDFPWYLLTPYKHSFLCSHPDDHAEFRDSAFPVYYVCSLSLSAASFMILTGSYRDATFYQVPGRPIHSDKL